ncbi:DcrB-related protein [Novosphingobium terrae]|uniref:DcrB-related protein n=1 Tax=Novosphingobium terrae TaxID=2726189 RepID=UPI00197DD94C|nr:DUF1795 domain-containing protein [Novosphingobium terrae]
MRYRVAEGSLALAAPWQDQSINVLLPRESRVQGCNLVIARDTLALGMGFQDYVIQQKQTFAAQLAGFELIADSPGTIDGHEAQFLEIGWKSDGKLIHQVMAIVAGEGQTVLNFTGSIPGGPDEETRGLLIAAITSFTFGA